MMLKICDVEMGYGESKVLFGTSLEVNEKEIVSLLGSNAAGKTTLIKGVSGVNKVWSGKIYFEDHDITNMSPEERVELGNIQCP